MVPEQSMRPESQAPFMILTGRNEDLKRTNNQRQTQFPGILVRGVGGMLNVPHVDSALKSFIENFRKNEI